MKLRPAELADSRSITSLINAAFSVERFFVDGDRITGAEVQKLFATGKFLLAEQDGDPTGCIYIEQHGDRAYLGLLSIHPSRQRAGLGSQLMAAAEQRCRERGCRYVDLKIVNVREELPAFYGRLGYVETGRSPFPSEAEVKMPCHFVEMSKALSPDPGSSED